MPVFSATFRDPEPAHDAVDALLAAGIPAERISMLVSNSTRKRFFPEQDGGLTNNIAAGAVAGGAVVGGLGVLAALTIGTGGAALLAAGPVAAALTGATSGVAVGSLLGGLVGAGFSQPVAEGIDDEIRVGALVVAVQADEAAGPEIERILGRKSTSVQPPTDGPIPPLPS
jgi:hypothetical protein